MSHLSAILHSMEKNEILAKLEKPKQFPFNLPPEGLELLEAIEQGLQQGKNYNASALAEIITTEFGVHVSVSTTHRWLKQKTPTV